MHDDVIYLLRCVIIIIPSHFTPESRHSTTEARSGCCRKRMEDWKRKRIYEKIKMYDEIHHRKVLVSDDDGWQGDARRNGIINNLS